VLAFFFDDKAGQGSADLHGLSIGCVLSSGSDLGNLVPIE
jgi:hypothetical protein